MKEVEDIRRENLRAESDRLGGDARLKEKLEKDKNQIYQWLRAEGIQRRNISTKLARAAERKLDREKGWLDTDHSSQPSESANELSEGVLQSRGKNNVRALRIAMQSFAQVLYRHDATLAAEVAADIRETAGTEFVSRSFLAALLDNLEPPRNKEASDPAASLPLQSSLESRRATSQKE